MKRFFSLLLILCLLIPSMIACDTGNAPAGDETNASGDERVAPKHDELDFSKVSNIDAVTVTDERTDYVLLEVEKYGKILIRLFPDVAPETVENFKSLVAEGFYDGLIFHRVINNFMIQGGDPRGNGTGGQTDANGNEINIRGEFYSNGFENNLQHVRGVVSMARANDPNSASSQFFICHQNYMNGNGRYASFGYVVYGMDTVDKIAKVKTNSNDKPLSDVVITSAKFASVSDEAFEEPIGSESTAVQMADLDFSTMDSIEGITLARTETDYVLLDVADFGKIVIRLYPNVAPETVANFKKLVSEGFYNGLIFHCVIDDFIIQGGDPEGTGFGGSDETIRGEFANNGFENNLSHVRGVVSMARTTDPNSATSQFFICQKDYTDGNGKYAAFGYVVYGMDTVDNIAKTPTNPDNKPKNDVVITSAAFVNVPTDSLSK